MYQHLYRRFLARHPHRLHFASHSHHYWPDVTRAAMLRYWDDAAALADAKWGYFFETVIPQAQRHIAGHLNLSQPQQLVFAPNTHEFVTRLLSCLPPGTRQRPVRVLTSDGEFHSFNRQISRLAEEPEYRVTRLAVDPIHTFCARCCQAIKTESPHLLFLSQVFFNSGLALTEQELYDLVTAIDDPDCLVVIDGYHAFCALPTNLRALEQRIFYLAGSYKYAQGGEGACFLHVPAGCRLRPRNTGWFAALDTLAEPQSGHIPYSDDGRRFAGATFDLSALYRFNAVMALLQQQGLDIAAVHRYVERLQTRFLQRLNTHDGRCLDRARLLLTHGRPHGHFLTFRLATMQQATRLVQDLARRDIIVDQRDDRVRFGFGLYQTEADIDALFSRLAFDRR